MLKLILGETPDIDELMRKRLGDISKRYDLRTTSGYNVSFIRLNEAKSISSTMTGKDASISTSEHRMYYLDNLNELLIDLNEYSANHNEIYVLSRENGTYKAAYGDKGDCSEASDPSPCKALCLAFLEFKGDI